MTHRRGAAGARRDEADLDRARAPCDTVDVATGEAGRGASTSAPTSAPCRPPASSPRRWWRWCWPTRCWRSSAATRSPRPRATCAATSTRCPSCATAAAAQRSRASAARGRARRAAGRGQDHGRPARSPSGSGAPFRDTDADVEARRPASRSRTIFVDDGEAAFRALERAAVAAALREHDGVLALGGGAVLDPRHARARWPATRWSSSTSGVADAARRVGLRATGRCCSATRGPVAAPDGRTGGRSTSEVADVTCRHRRAGRPTTSPTRWPTRWPTEDAP